MKRLTSLAVFLLFSLLSFAQRTESPWTTAELANGTFYLYNVESGMWLQNNRRASGRWTTSAELGPHGFDFVLTALEDGKYQIDPRFGHNHSLNGQDDVFYMDTPRPVSPWTIEKEGLGYIIYCGTFEDGHFLYVSGDDELGWFLDDYSDFGTWQLVTKEARMADLKKATMANPKDATWLIDDWDFANQNDRYQSWKNEITGSGSGIAFREGYGGRIWNRAAECWSKGTGEFYQVLSNIPNGTYGLTVQGFYRDGSTSGVTAKYLEKTEEIRGWFFANEVSQPLMSICDNGVLEADDSMFPVEQDGFFLPGDGGDCLPRATNAFLAGYYVNPEIKVVVSDGTLRIGIRKESDTTDDWLCFDNFQLKYYGNGDRSPIQFVDANVKNICVANWDIDGDGELSKEEATFVTDLGQVFLNNADITSFNELQYFTDLTTIGKSAFNGCTNLNSIIIPNNVKNICEGAFKSTALKAISIPYNVTFIAEDAFYNCTTLERIVVDKKNTKYDSRDNCNAIIESASNSLVVGCKQTRMPNSTIRIGNCAFSGCSSLTSITIPDSVTTIERNAFKDCVNLKSITVGKSLTTIEEYAFSGCDSLKSVTFHCKLINSWFRDNSNIKEIIIGEEVTSIGDGAFQLCSGLTSITIYDGVTSIGDGAFSDCSGITSIIIPNSVTSIGDRAFKNNSGLTSIIIPNSVTNIGGSAFQGCSGLTSITIPNSVTTIGDYAFNACTGLTTITIPNSVISIGSSAFYNCSGVESVTFHCKEIGSWFSGFKKIKEVIIGEEVTSIGDGAFSGCRGLTSITIPEGVTSIGRAAFSDCDLSSITIPNSAISINDNAFKDCDGIESITFHCKEIGPWFRNHSYLKKIILGKETTSIDDSAFSGCYDLTSITLFNSFVNIGNNFNEGYSKSLYFMCEKVGTGFSGNKYIKEVVLGDGVKTIDKEAFKNCSNLQLLEVSTSVTSIGQDAFSGTAWYESQSDGIVYVGLVAYRYKGQMQNDSKIALKKGIKVIAGGAFADCRGLASITIPNSLTNIGDNAFHNCSGLSSVTIPESVTSIGCSAFNGCSKLSSIVLPKDLTVIEGSMFVDCRKLISVSIPEGIGKIGNKAFSGCLALASLNIPENVTEIGSSAFSGCSAIESINIPKGLEIIADSTFLNCSKLKNIAIHNNIKSIGIYSFGACTSLETIIIPGSVNSIGNGAFWGCNNLSSATMLNGVTSIGDNCFQSCSNITSVIIPNSVKKIGSYSFADCSKIESFILPESVESLGEYALYNCENIKEITIPNNLKSIGKFSFGNCYNLTTIDIGQSVNSIEKDAFNNCNAITSVSFSCPRVNSWFNGIKSIKKVALREGVEAIGENAFNGCSNIKTLEIGNTVATIGNGAFSGCSGLTAVSLPESVSKIGENAFVDCSSLKNFYCYATTVPTTSNKAFLNKDIANATLYIPSESLEDYNYEEPWINFGKIVSFSQREYALTYMIDGEVYKTDSVDLGTPIVAEGIPIKEGYTFSGWSEIPENMPANDVIITGSFKINSYKLTYYVDGEEYKTITLEYKSPISALEEPKKEGYLFTGWSLIPSEMPAHNVDVAGAFTVNSYKVTFKYGDEVLTTEKVEYGAVIPLPESLNSDRYTLVKWLDVPETMPARDIIIQADYVDGVRTIQSADSDTDFYQLNGVKNSQLKRGLNIIHTKDGKFKKVRVK